MTIVFDASVVFKLLVAEEDSADANNLAASSHLAVPELVFAEIGNVLWSRIRNGRADADTGQILISRLLAMPIEVLPIRPLIGRALILASHIEHPIYDCLYLALAEQLDCPLVTADLRFLAAIRRHPLSGAKVKSLADFA